MTYRPIALHYRKAEIEDLTRAVSRHWGGLIKDWVLVVNPADADGATSASLHVAIELDSGTHVTTIPLSHTRTGHPHGRPTPSAYPGCVAAVRRQAFLSLLEQCAAHGPEPLLGYLRCCGVLVID